MTDENFNRDYRIDQLNKKGESFGNDVSEKRRYKFKFKEILKDERRFRNRSEFNIEDKICSLRQTYHIKREDWFGDTKLNGVNCRRLMEKMKR